MTTILAFSSIMKYVGYIAIAILVLLLMVLIHELGHYIAGKALKFKINEFSIGFGPKLFQKTNKSGEKISLRAFPLGGFCAFEGEDETKPNNPNAFSNQKPWKRLIVLFAGAFFNFLSAIIFSFILLMANGYDLVEVDKVSVDSINYSILLDDDVIYGIDNKDIDFVKDFHFNTIITSTVANNYGKYYDNTDRLPDSLEDEYEFTLNNKTYYLVQEELIFNVKRDGKKIAVNGCINVAYDTDGDYYSWTLLSSEENIENEFVISTHKYTFFEALTQSIPFTCKWAYKIIVIFGQLITGKLSLSSLGGPVTTINTIASYTQQSFVNLLVFFPLIAVNLAVFNLLPIPALDGFQMIFVTIEWIRKKPVKQEVINTINNLGLMILLGLVILLEVFQFSVWR